MVDHNITIFIFRNALALLCAASIGISPAIPVKDVSIPKKDCLVAVVPVNDEQVTLSARASLWRYLRNGLNYLEVSGKNAPTYFKHPGGAAYGPLALTKIAVEDVKLRHPSMRRYAFGRIIRDPCLYERFARLYAELLLRHYLKIDYTSMPKIEVFDILQKAWYLGPTLYAKGHPVIPSRQFRAREYISGLFT